MGLEPSAPTLNFPSALLFFSVWFCNIWGFWLFVLLWDIIHSFSGITLFYSGNTWILMFCAALLSLLTCSDQRQRCVKQQLDESWCWNLESWVIRKLLKGFYISYLPSDDLRQHSPEKLLLFLEKGWNSAVFFPEASFFESLCVRSTLSAFPGGSLVKNPPANVGDVGSIPESRRSPGVCVCVVCVQTRNRRLCGIERAGPPSVYGTSGCFCEEVLLSWDLKDK